MGIKLIDKINAEQTAKLAEKNFPEFQQKDVAIATFGPATAKAVKEAGLRLDLEAPTEKYPSMTGALQHYLLEHEEE